MVLFIVLGMDFSNFVANQPGPPPSIIKNEKILISDIKIHAVMLHTCFKYENEGGKCFIRRFHKQSHSVVPVYFGDIPYGTPCTTYLYHLLKSYLQYLLHNQCDFFHHHHVHHHQSNNLRPESSQFIFT